MCFIIIHITFIFMWMLYVGRYMWNVCKFSIKSFVIASTLCVHCTKVERFYLTFNIAMFLNFLTKKCARNQYNVIRLTKGVLLTISKLVKCVVCKNYTNVVFRFCIKKRVCFNQVCVFLIFLKILIYAVKKT